MSAALDLQPEASVTTRALLDRTDWQATSLGPRANWPAALSAVVDTVLDSQIPKVLMWGPDHVMVYNDGYREIAGDKHPAAFGGTVPDVWPEIWDWNRRVLETGLAGRAETYRDQPMRLHRNGALRDVVFDLFYTPIRDGNSGIGGVLCTVIERTEREGLRRSNDRFRAAVAAIHSTLWTNSAEGRMSGEQPGWSALTGQTQAEYEGFGWAAAVHPEDADATVAAWNEAVATRSTFIFEHRVRVASGEWRQFAIRAVPILDDNGALREWVGVHTDVTEERLAQEQLREHASVLERQIRHRQRAEEQLRQLNETLEHRVAQAVEERRAAEAALNRSQRLETVGKLTGGVAHDFNNLLQVVSGNLQLLLKDIAGNERAETRVRNALAGVSRGAKLAAQLLAFGRRQALEPKVVNVTRFVRGMDDMLRRAIGEGIEVETVFGGGLWNTFIDPTQIENALLNLAINARDAMEGQGKLTIELGNAHLDDDYARRHEVAAGQYVMLAVSDTGSGMSPEVIERVFEPFFTTKAEGKGSGLGLSMVYGFVKQSGGHVNIYSEVGQGTTIRLYLPRSTQSEDQEIAVDTGPVTGGTETVLVVEDDEEVRATAVEMLTDLGYRVLKAVDAQSALNVVESGIPIDILFTDVVMPGKLKSPELARKAKERLPGLAVLFTSGYTENSIVHGGRLDAGVQLLSKPYTREALARKFRHVLANQAQANGARRAALKGPALAPAAADAPTVKTGGLGAAAPKPEPTGKGTVLLVEDDGLIRMNTADMLKDLGYVVFEAGRAEDALTAIQTVPFDVLVSDVNLPGMSGTELADEARKVKPGTGIVFATGDRHVAGVTPGEDPRVTILPKPYGMEDLEAAIASVLEAQREMA
ncbi:response regulator [Aureimonas phyllosphaerae]|uniref:histidine kinase n=1 Tax=Aureimonas phyllosphaerae TaxID=1166078 RepID=A0A7W6BQ71_9HYPH|nr:response regulator [Aureimonas phyllosphaerae]MBB3936051.1 PAS domain S-box-containing protein [Aureimonas phyllosphaerae]MBB3960224.1 PAS domain S-box-containing protein [Aureimonas phyllosphaerae]SFF35307.1 PAS domain S-box-containing protein [Aureimonas phyllosphaerae]